MGGKNLQNVSVVYHTVICYQCLWISCAVMLVTYEFMRSAAHIMNQLIPSVPFQELEMPKPIAMKPEPWLAFREAPTSPRPFIHTSLVMGACVAVHSQKHAVSEIQHQEGKKKDTCHTTTGNLNSFIWSSSLTTMNIGPCSILNIRVSLKKNPETTWEKYRHDKFEEYTIPKKSRGGTRFYEALGRIRFGGLLHVKPNRIL